MGRTQHKRTCYRTPWEYNQQNPEHGEFYRINDLALFNKLQGKGGGPYTLKETLVTK